MTQSRLRSLGLLMTIRRRVALTGERLRTKEWHGVVGAECPERSASCGENGHAGCSYQTKPAKIEVRDSRKSAIVAFKKCECIGASFVVSENLQRLLHEGIRAPQVCGAELLVRIIVNYSPHAKERIRRYEVGLDHSWISPIEPLVQGILVMFY